MANSVDPDLTPYSEASDLSLDSLPRSVWSKTEEIRPIVSFYPVSILYKSIEGRYRPVRVADGPITARYRFIKNASWVLSYFRRLYLLETKLINK